MPRGDITEVKGRPVSARAMLIALAIESLIEGPCTYADLSRITGVSQDALGDWIKEFRRRSLVHVEVYRPDPRGAPIVAAFRWRPGAQDCAKPRPLSNTQKCRRARERAAAREGLPPPARRARARFDEIVTHLTATQ